MENKKSKIEYIAYKGQKNQELELDFFQMFLEFLAELTGSMLYQ